MIKYVKASPDANGFMTDEELDAYVSEQKAKRDAYYAEQENAASRGSRVEQARSKKAQAEQDKQDRYTSDLRKFAKIALEIAPTIQSLIDIGDVINLGYVKGLSYGEKKLGKACSSSLRDGSAFISTDYDMWLKYYRDGKVKFCYLYKGVSPEKWYDFTSAMEMEETLNKLIRPEFRYVYSHMCRSVELIRDYANSLLPKADKALDDYLADEE